MTDAREVGRQVAAVTQAYLERGGGRVDIDTGVIEVRGEADVPRLLLAARTAAGLSQRQAAQRCPSIGQPDISAYERGTVVPGTHRLLMLLEVYGWRLQATPDERAG